ncbi:hypothetical protein ATJ97_3282 [Georgenia soli]|uniref:Uncharacterized protein n=1 Tax=Georgenia soli TaxID=638953 RepID=A0A2A9EPA1_9MICO|nr:hypothetical protein [Georgenia soli]PFG40748.1 hypothetical protein ATJ97_3282 [Georgenia soli]
MKRRAPIAVATAVVVALLTSCSASGGGDTAAGTSGTSAGKEGVSKAGQDPSAGGGGEDSAGGTSAGVADVDPADVLVEQAYTVPGSEDTATIGVHSLVVDGDVMTLRLVLTPEFSSVSDTEAVSVHDIVGHAGRFAPMLVDREHLKEYDIVGGGPTEWTSDNVYTKVTNGEPMVWWGVYAAPQDDIDTVDVRVLDELPEFTDVPITR